MKYKNIIDMHSHSELSFDASDSCNALCESAIKKGAVAIAITDHCDIDGEDDFDSYCKEQFEATKAAKEKFDGRLKVYQGLEIGQGIYRKNKVEKYLSLYDYDFILGSLHNLENEKDFYYLHYTDIDVYPLLQRYFDDILKLCEWGAFDSLAHLTYPLRYIKGREGIKVDLSRFDDVIDEIFKSLIKNGKALEINTSGLFGELKDTMPDKALIKKYKELGGKYITIGSDSHYANKMCQGITDGYEIAKECGFDQVTVFEKRQPVLINIE